MVQGECLHLTQALTLLSCDFSRILGKEGEGIFKGLSGYVSLTHSALGYST